MLRSSSASSLSWAPRGLLREVMVGREGGGVEVGGVWLVRLARACLALFSAFAARGSERGSRAHRVAAQRRNCGPMRARLLKRTRCPRRCGACARQRLRRGARGGGGAGRVVRLWFTNGLGYGRAAALGADRAGPLPRKDPGAPRSPRRCRRRRRRLAAGCGCDARFVCSASVTLYARGSSNRCAFFLSDNLVAACRSLSFRPPPLSPKAFPPCRFLLFASSAVRFYSQRHTALPR